MSTGGHDQDRTLEQAAAALRDSAVPDGPSSALKAATLSALKGRGHLEYESAVGRRRTMRLALKIAAVIVIVGCGLLVYTYLHRPVRPNPNFVVIPPPPATTAPVPRPRDSQLVDTDTRHAVRPANPDRVQVAAGGASVTGTVRFAGEAPEAQQIDMSAIRECAFQHPNGALDDSLVVNNGRLANVVVWIKPADGQQLPAAAAPASSAVLDQKGCQYHPHVLAMMVGQPIVVSNSDAFLHNVHALSVDNPPFNMGQPTRDPGRNVGVMKAAEIFKVKCDVHPWMGAYIHVIDHPYFAVTGSDGTYAIPAGLPDGTYTLVAWHEKLGEKQAQVVVVGGRAGRADFEFSAN